MFHILFYTPEIPGNTGNAIRLAAVTGSHLHVVEPLGFDLEEKKVRRAGLDYHDMASLTAHKSLKAAWDYLRINPDDRFSARVFAFSSHGSRAFTTVGYRPGDILLFGKESSGLPENVLADPHVTATVRIPMLSNRRSLNLGNAASIAVYEAWRQNSFANAGGPDEHSTSTAK